MTSLAARCGHGKEAMKLNEITIGQDYAVEEHGMVKQAKVLDIRPVERQVYSSARWDYRGHKSTAKMVICHRRSHDGSLLFVKTEKEQVHDHSACPRGFDCQGYDLMGKPCNSTKTVERSTVTTEDTGVPATDAYLPQKVLRPWAIEEQGRLARQARERAVIEAKQNINAVLEAGGMDARTYDGYSVKLTGRDLAKLVRLLEKAGE